MYGKDYKTMIKWSTIGKVACGFVIGTAGVKLLSSKDAKKCYTHVTAAAYRCKDSVMETYTNIKENCQDIDAMAGLFGQIMALITSARDDEWSDNLKSLGYYLGEFIYLLDAYEDVEEDIKKKRYNPFISRYGNPEFEEDCHTILTMIMAECCKEFEKLPLLENVEILRNILYSGVWCRYEIVRKKRQTNHNNGNIESGKGTDK